MLFGQWSARKSLRDLVCSVNRQVRKCYHLGLAALKGSTLADAKQQRPAIIFEKIYYKLYERLSAELATQPQEAPKIKIIDATSIDRCAAVFPWARLRTRKGAINLHTVLTGLLPQCVLVTGGKTHDRRATQDLHFDPDDLLIFDRAYLDYAWLYRLHKGGVWFVIRLKTNSRYEVVQSRAASGPGLGWACLVIVLDWFSRTVVGGSCPGAAAPKSGERLWKKQCYRSSRTGCGDRD